MMILKALPISLIFIAFLIAIVGLGVVYGAWTSAVEVNSTIQTGSFAPLFGSVSAVSSLDSVECNAVIKTADAKSPWIELTIVNAIPGFSCAVTLEIKNYGSVPAALQEINFTPEKSDTFSVLTWGANKPTCGETMAAGASKVYQFTYSLPVGSNPPQNATFHSVLEFDLTQFNTFDPDACSISAIPALP